MLNIIQCTNREKVMYDSGRLEGTLQIGGMITPQLMTPPTPSPGRNSRTSSESNTYPRV
jgi:hypothetical protein